MRFLFLILWLVLGAVYYLTWSANAGTCCGGEGLSGISNAATTLLAADGEEDDAEVAEMVDEGESDESEEESDEEGEEEAEVEDTVEVIETDDSATIRFPFNSDRKISDKGLDEYMAKVAERVKNSGESISLVGHADNDGSAPQFNYNLGMDRARAIRDLLRNLGVPTNKISVSSQGHNDPIADNSSEQGRAQNRRVELTIN